MRADRLVAILALLQTRGQVTASEIAQELEVSERTARRDLDALGMAGIPVYAVQGRHGGWRLAGGGRTDLSGLTASEARALFRVAGPSSSATPEVRAALRKLVRALPEPFRDAAAATESSVVVDAQGWGDGRRAPSPHRPPEYLDDAQRAVVEGRQLELGYRARDGASSTRLVEPLGLACKGTAWYLVADTPAGLRTFRVDRITSVAFTGEPATRPADFDLRAAWSLISEEVDRRRAPLVARVQADPGCVNLCRWLFGSRLSIGPPSEAGQVSLEIRGADVRSLAGELAGLGAMIEIVDPVPLRDALALIGDELTDLYRPKTAAVRTPSRDGTR